MRTRACAASRVARLRSMSAFDMKPRDTSVSARASSDWARSASACGKKVATAAGAVAGGYVGNRVDRKHVGGQVVNRTERQCHTVTDTSESSHVVGYDVTSRTADGSTDTMRMGSKPGSRIPLGTQDKTVG